jgi:hypothetical protein
MLMGVLSLNGGFSIVMFEYWRVHPPENKRRQDGKHWLPENDLRMADPYLT